MLERRTALLIVLGSLAILAGTDAASGRDSADFRVLVFTKTAGYRHESIPAAIASVEQLGAQNHFAVDQTEDATAFTTANLSHYATVVFLLTTGDVLDTAQQRALTRYVEAGGGFVGVHSASDTEHDWPWYGGLVGAFWKSHSGVVAAQVQVANRSTPSTIHLPARWNRVDEWYAFDRNPSPGVTVLTTLAPDRPLSWQHVYDGGRSWYTAMGHTPGSYDEPLFRRFLLGGILWAAGYDLPKLQSVVTTVVGARLRVRSDHSRCRCSETLSVHTARGVVVTRVSAVGTRTRLVTRTLPRGRWRYTLVLEDAGLQAHATARGTVRVD